MNLNEYQLKEQINTIIDWIIEDCETEAKRMKFLRKRLQKLWGKLAEQSKSEY